MATSKKDSIGLPKSNLLFYGFSRDTNGNPTVSVGFYNKRPFSIQVNGTETKNTWKLSKGKPKPSELSEKEISMIADEIVSYVKKFGSKQQKQSLK